MAKITVTVEGSNIGSATIVTEYNQADSDRFVAWLSAHYGTDAEGNPRNLAGMASAYWDAVKSGTHANIIRFEAEQAAQAAREAVTNMSYTTTVS